MIDATYMLTGPFLDYLRYERNYSEHTINAYGRDIEQFGEFIQGKAMLFVPGDVTTSEVREWVISLMDEGASSSTVCRKLSTLRSFYKYLLRKGEVKVDPTRKVVSPKKKKTLPSFVKESDMDKLLDEEEFSDDFSGCRDRLIIQLFYSTGIRLAELVGLNDADVDFSSSLIKVTGKRNKQRLIPFGDELRNVMQNYIEVRDREISVISGAFIVKDDGERITRRLVYIIVKRNLSKVVTLKKRSPHVLRHTFATTMLNNEAQLGAVKELLGHSSLSATEVYTHTTFEELKKIYKQAHPRA